MHGEPPNQEQAQAGAAQRASDHEREAVVDRRRTAAAEGRLTLDEFGDRVAQVLETKTVGELVPLTADLPPLPPLRSSAGRAVGPVTGGPAAPRRRLVSVFGRARYTGSWEIAPTTTVVAVFGHGHVDITGCRLPPGVELLELRTFGVFAGVEVVVPRSAAVDVSGAALFGGRHLQHDGPSVGGEAPLRVRVRSYGLFGGLLVRNHRRVP